MQILPRPGIVYLLTFINGDEYVGKTYDLPNRRFNEYRRGGRPSQAKLYQALQTQGDFAVTVLMQGIQTLEGLNAAERAFISIFDTFRNGLNSTTGGDGGYIQSLDVRKRKSAKTKGVKKHAGHGALVSATHKARGVMFPRWALEKAWAQNTGKHHTVNHRKAISDSLRGKPKSPEHCAAISKTNAQTRLPKLRRVVELRERGWSFNRIAREVGVSMPTVSAWCVKYAAGEDGYRLD